MAFAPDYIKLVLEETFEDAKVLLLEPLLAIQYAHLVMLADRRLIAADDAHAIREALDALDLEAVRAAEFDGSVEDLYFFVSRLVGQRCGTDRASALQMARSRNDVDMTMYRLRLREGLLTLTEAALRLRRAALAIAERHHHTLLAVHTHGQPAQPTTLAHYLLAVIEQLERDAVRLRAAFATVNRSPLGACAITGTGFAIDRQRTSALLGFDAPTGNTYGSIAAVDYLLEASAAMATLLTGLGRVVQDLLFWATAEVGYVRLPDGFVQTSSIMPQKRNPVAFEHARALASRALAQAQAVWQVVHNTPFGDVVDTEDDLQPLVAGAFRDGWRAVELVAVTVAVAEFDVDRMRARAGSHWVTATELADTLARDHRLPFGAAHAVAAALVGRAGLGARPIGELASELREAARSVGSELNVDDETLARTLSPEYFVAVRETPGGPGPAVTAAALADARERLRADETWAAATRAHLAAARSALRSAADTL
jgi:argininosuccinate lyase